MVPVSAARPLRRVRIEKSLRPDIPVMNRLRSSRVSLEKLSWIRVPGAWGSVGIADVDGNVLDTHWENGLLMEHVGSHIG